MVTSLGGSSATAQGGTARGGTPIGGSGGTSTGGTTFGVSSIVVDETAHWTSDDMKGVTFEVRRVEMPTFDWRYQFSAELPVRAYETQRYCGMGARLQLVTCDVWQIGCLSISVDLSSATAIASFLGPENESRTFHGWVDALQAPLFPLAEPPAYGLVGSFDFVDDSDGSVTLQGTFGVRFTAQANLGSLLIIC